MGEEEKTGSIDFTAATWIRARRAQGNDDSGVQVGMMDFAARAKARGERNNADPMCVKTVKEERLACVMGGFRLPH